MRLPDRSMVGLYQVGMKGTLGIEGWEKVEQKSGSERRRHRASLWKAERDREKEKYLKAKKESRETDTKS